MDRESHICDHLFGKVLVLYHQINDYLYEVTCIDCDFNKVIMNLLSKAINNNKNYIIVVIFQLIEIDRFATKSIDEFFQ